MALKREGHLLVELDVLQDFDGLVVVAQQGVKPQEAHQAEVAQHFVERVAAVLPSHALWVTWNPRGKKTRQLPCRLPDAVNNSFRIS